MNSTDLFEFVSSSLMKMGFCRSLDEFDVRVMSSGNSVRCDYLVLLDFLRLPDAAALKALRRIETTLQLRMKEEPSHHVVNFYVRIAASGDGKLTSIPDVTATPFSVQFDALRELKWPRIASPSAEAPRQREDSQGPKPPESLRDKTSDVAVTEQSAEVVAVCPDRRMAVLWQGSLQYSVISWGDGAAPALGHRLFGELRHEEWRNVLNWNTGRLLSAFVHLDKTDQADAMDLFSGFAATAPMTL